MSEPEPEPTPDPEPEPVEPEPEPVDPRPLFTITDLPGGLWRSYRTRSTIAAVYVRGEFRVYWPAADAETEHRDAYVFINGDTDALNVLSPSEFAERYESVQ